PLRRVGAEHFVDEDVQSRAAALLIRHEKNSELLVYQAESVVARCAAWLRDQMRWHRLWEKALGRQMVFTVRWPATVVADIHRHITPCQRKRDNCPKIHLPRWWPSCKTPLAAAARGSLASCG